MAQITIKGVAKSFGAFKALHPEIDIDLRSVASAAALTGAEIDLAVRTGSARRCNRPKSAPPSAISFHRASIRCQQ